MNTEIAGSMELFRMARNICFGLAIVFAILAVLAFIVFDIRTIFMIKTGRAQRKMIDEMNERNQHTGKLRADIENDRGSTKKNRAEKTVKERAQKTQQNSGTFTNEVLGDIPEKFKSNTMENIFPNNFQEYASTSKATTLLSDTDTHMNKGKFRITKRVIVTHTDENIAV